MKKKFEKYSGFTNLSGGGQLAAKKYSKTLAALCLLTCVPATYSASLTDTTLGADSAYNLSETADKTSSTITKYEINNAVQSAQYMDINGNTQSVDYNYKTADPKYFNLNYNIATQSNPNHPSNVPYPGSEYTNNRLVNEAWNDVSSINESYIGNYPGWSSENFGGAINNKGTIASITGDFLRNYMLWDNGKGGAIYNDVSGASIGDIKGDFIGNYAYSNKPQAMQGGAIYNTNGAKINSITGQFIENYTQSASISNRGGAIYNDAGAIIGNITGDFSGNHISVKAYDEASSDSQKFGGTGSIMGGAIYNDTDAQIGVIKGNFVNNYIDSDSWGAALGGAIYNGSKIESIEGDFINNFTTTQYRHTEGGAIYNYGSIAEGGVLKSNFYGNHAVGKFTEINSDGTQYVQGGAIYNNLETGKIGDIVGDFVNNYVKIEDSKGAYISKGGAIFNAAGAQIGNITGNFVGNYAQFKDLSYSSGDNYIAYGGAIANINGAKIGDITGDFVDNHACGGAYYESMGGAIYNDNGSQIGNIISQFIIGNSSNYGGAIANIGGATIESIKADYIANNTASVEIDPNRRGGGAIYNGEGSSIKNGIQANFVNNKGAFGGAISNHGTIGDITGSFVKNSSTGSHYSVLHGGAIFNKGTIGNILGDFIENSSNNYGAAIFNSSNGVIKDIKGDFIKNYAYDGDVIYNSGTIGNIEGNFKDNTAIRGSIITNQCITHLDNSDYNPNIQMGHIKGHFDANKPTQSVIYNSSNATLKDADGNSIIGSFTNNTAGKSVILNHGVMGNVLADFENNKVSDYDSSSYTALGGGAIRNEGKMGNIEGNFKNNTYANTYNSNNANGGAILNSGQIADIIGSFIENSASNYGAAVFNANTGTIQNIKGDFIGNVGKSTITNIGRIEGGITGRFVSNKAPGDFNSYSSTIIDNSRYSYYSYDAPNYINFIKADFEGNTASTIIDSPVSEAVINTIEGNFKDNTVAYYGIYNGGKIGDINAKFINTKFAYDSDSSSTIYSWGQIDNITGEFKNNSDFNARGIGNSGIIKSIIANFEGNASNSYGGAVFNSGTIDTLKGDFINNSVKVKYTYGENGAKGGGAIYNSGTIGEIVNSSFINNSVNTLHAKSKGGAIYSETDLNITAKDGYTSIFDGNTLTYNGVTDSQGIYMGGLRSYISGNRYGAGGIYEQNPSTLNLNAENGGTFVINDKISGFSTPDARLYNNGWNSSLSKDEYYYIDEYGNRIDTPDKLKNYTVNFKGDETGKVILNNDITAEKYDYVTNEFSKGGAADINLYLVTLHLGKRENVMDGNNLNLHSGTINMINNSVGVSALNSLTVSGDTKFYGDVDLAGEQMDRFTAKEYGSHDGDIVVSGLNMLSDMAENKSELKILFAENGLKEHVRSEIGDLPNNVQTEYYTPIFKYVASYEKEEDAGYYKFVRGGEIKPVKPIDPNNPFIPGGGSSSDNGYNHNNWHNFNPAVLATPVAMQAGAQAAINETFRLSFEHADTFSKLPAAARFAQINANKYAITDFNNNIPVSPEYDSKGIWARPYSTFESINLDNGPSVDAISYGSLFGFDTDIREMKNGWSNVFTGYVGYNGSSMNFNHVDTTMNGGMLGFTETFYKKNFWTAITMSAGASVGETRTMYGKDDITSLMAGIGSKTGYNFEFNEGRFIIQPVMFLGYTFVNTFDYTNAAGVKIDSDPLHTIQINPSIRFIGNLKNGWQPYASVGMVWNVLNDTKVTANNIQLPQMSIKPYVEYGVGIQRSWADKFTAYFQTMLRNGGRNGVALTGGFRWAVGAESKGREKHTIKESI